MSDKEDFCPHTEDCKSYSWQSQSFSEKYNSEYEYCYCKVCKKQRYTGTCRFVEVKELKGNEYPRAKEQKRMSKDKLSVSRSLKALHAKDERGLSLKEFARRLLASGGADVHPWAKLAQDWFDNKAGACNAGRSAKAQGRIDQERTATKNAKRKKKA